MLTYIQEIAINVVEDFEKPTWKDYFYSAIAVAGLAIFIWVSFIPNWEPQVRERGSLIVVSDRQPLNGDKDVVTGIDVSNDQIVSVLVSKDFPTKNGEKQAIIRHSGYYTKTKHEYIVTDIDYDVKYVQ